MAKKATKKTPKKRENPADRVRSHQFKKGNPGGPGRPKGVSVTRILTAKCETEGEAIADALIVKAKSGDVPAIKEIFDRIDGKVAQIIDAKVSAGDLSEADAAAVAAHLADMTPEGEAGV